MQGFEQQGRQRQFRDEPRGHPHHDGLVDQQDLVIAKGRSRNPNSAREEITDGLPERRSRTDQLHGKRDHQGRAEISDEDTLLRIDEGADQFTEVV